MTKLTDTFVSNGSKFFYHQEAMRKLRDGRGQPIVTHVMPTDICQHSCAFCSVQTRNGDMLRLRDILDYLDILLEYGLKAVILSGGGNPILYRCPDTGLGFNSLVTKIHDRGLEIGLITNGMPLREYQCEHSIRESWGTVRPETLDMLSWVRISMSGLDHEENEVFVPDIDTSKTTLGFSYVLHDLYPEPADPHHGKVSTPSDLITLGDARSNLKTWWAKDRLPELENQIARYVRVYKPRYVRLLPNCLEPNLIAERCALLQEMAVNINSDVVFVQHKPPAAPNVCYLGYVHPVLNSDGYVYPCDSCVLNEKAGHRFNEPWRVCHWSEVARIYEEPVRSLVDPKKLCPGCVFTQSNLLLEGVRNNYIGVTPPVEVPEHANFI